MTSLYYAMNLVAGAPGLLGSEICRLLAERGEHVRGLVRASTDPEKVERLRSLGVTTVVGDVKDPESLAAACEGASTVLSTVSSTFSRSDGDTIESVDRDGQLALVDAAAAAGVRRFVYVSFTEMAVDSPLQRAKRAVERRLRESPLDHTILRPTHFMEVWLSPAVGFDAANGTATIYGSGERPVSWVSVRDVARLAVAALDDPALRQASVDFGGPEALSPLEVVRLFEEETGRKLALEHVPEEALQGQMETATNSLEQSFAALMLATARSRAVPAAKLPGLRSVRDHAVEGAAAVHR
jgi:NADH dehydrogenase